MYTYAHINTLPQVAGRLTHKNNNVKHMVEYQRQSVEGTQTHKDSSSG